MYIYLRYYLWFLLLIKKLLFTEVQLILRLVQVGQLLFSEDKLKLFTSPYQQQNNRTWSHFIHSVLAENTGNHAELFYKITWEILVNWSVIILMDFIFFHPIPIVFSLFYSFWLFITFIPQSFFLLLNNPWPCDCSTFKQSYSSPQSDINASCDFIYIESL